MLQQLPQWSRQAKRLQNSQSLLYQPLKTEYNMPQQLPQWSRQAKRLQNSQSLLYQPLKIEYNMPQQLSWQSKGLKIPVSLVQFRVAAYFLFNYKLKELGISRLFLSIPFFRTFGRKKISVVSCRTCFSIIQKWCVYYILVRP